MPGSHSKKDKLKKKIRKARKTVVRDKTNEGYEPTKLKGKKRIPPSRVSPNWAVTKKSYPTSDYQRKVEYEQDKELGEDAVSVSESNAKKYSKLKKRIAKQLLGVEFGTLGPDGKVTNKGSIDLDKIDSDDPIAYSMGYSEGTQNTKINPKGVEISPGVYDDYAPEYKRGWSEGNLFFKKTLKKTKGKGKFSKVRKADQQDINRVKRWDSRSFNKKKELSGTTEPVFKTTGAIKPLTTDLRNRLAKIRKANGGIAPNYNNPSKVRKKKTATKAASHTKEDPDRVEQIDKFMKNSPSGEKMIEDSSKDPERFYDQFEEMKGYATKGIKINPSRRSTGKKIDRKLRKKLAKQKTALRSAVNKGVNKVNVIKPTKTYKDTINIKEEDPDRIKQNATTIGRKPTYTGKITKKKTKDYLMVNQSPLFEGTEARGKRKIPPSRVSPDAGMVGVEDVSDLEKSLKTKRRKYKLIGPNAKSVSRSEAIQMSKLKKRVARIRKAGEQIDPRVKKRKTVRPDSPVQKVSQMKDRIAELKTAKDHSHSIAFRKHEGQYYRRASLAKQEGKYAKYWLLNAKQTNGNGWGVSPVSIAKNIHKFIGRPFVITAKQWIAESEYGDQFEHPYLPTNNIDNIINHQEKFRVGSIVDVVEKDGDYHAVIEMNSKFANMMLPPFCSPAIFQNNPGEADGEISDWEALHLAGLMEDPAYGARIALLKGSCMGTAEACSIQFKAAKQTTMCPKKKAKLVRRIDRLGD